MSWSRTNEWLQALREVSAEIERRRDGQLPWQPRYAEIFGDRQGLLRDLRNRWVLMQQAQIDDDYDADGRTSAQWRELADRNRGLLLVLDHARRSAATRSIEPALAY